MAKPSTVVDWDATGNIVEPSAGKKTDGWLPGEQPPAEYMNWLFNSLGLWSEYLNGLESTEALTWALSQVFNKAITLGASFAASETEAVSPRLIVEPVSSAVADHTCIAKFKDARLWTKGLGSDSSFSLTVNATRTTAGADTWTKITTSQPAFIFQVNRDGLSFGSMPATQNTAWTDAYVQGDGTTSGWGRTLFFQSEGGARTAANQDLPLITQQFNTGTVPRGYIGQFKISTVAACRLYVVRVDGALSDQGFEIVFGATWDNTNTRWVRDVASNIVKYDFGPLGFYCQFKTGGTIGTTFTTWDSTPFDFQLPTSTSGATNHTKPKLSNGTIAVVDTGSADLDDANPPAQTAQANKIGVRNVPKVLASLSTGASPAILSGYNIAASTPISYSGSVLTLNFNAAFDQAAYECTVTCEDGSTTDFYLAQVKTKNVGSVDIAVAKMVVGGAISLVNLSVTNIKLNVTITAKQTT